MSDFNISPIDGNGLRVKASLMGGVLFSTFAGSAELGSMAPLSSFLTTLHAEAIRLRIGSVVVDFRELEFMNSSCFKVFVTWLNTLQEAPPAQQYRIRFVSDPSKHWQRRSLGALRCFAVDLIDLDAP